MTDFKLFNWYDCGIKLPERRAGSLVHRRTAMILRAKGCTVLDVGWPDLLVERNGEIFALEVKGPSDRVSRNQKKIHDLLRKAGIQVGIARVNRQGMIEKIENLKIKE